MKPRNVVEEQIARQPDLLRGVCSRSGELRSRIKTIAPHRVVLVGCGDMGFAALLVERLTRGWTLATEGCESMDFRWRSRTLDRGTCVVAASVSGRTPRTVEALLTAVECGSPVVALTDDPGSPLALAADVCFVMGSADPKQLAAAPYAGYSSQVGQTATFTATLMTELLLCAHFVGGSVGAALEQSLWRVPEEIALLLEVVPRQLPKPTQEYGDGAAHAAAELLQRGLFPQVRVVGSGPWRQVAAYGAAKFTEYAIPSGSQCIEELHHLDVYVLPPRSWVVVLALDAESLQRCEELVSVWRELRWNVVLITAAGCAASFGLRGEAQLQRVELPSVDDPVIACFAAIVALQRIALHIAHYWKRDVDQWLGGVQPEFHNGISQRSVRGSKARAWPHRDGAQP